MNVILKGPNKTIKLQKKMSVSFLIDQTERRKSLAVLDEFFLSLSLSLLAITACTSNLGLA